MPHYAGCRWGHALHSIDDLGGSALRAAAGALLAEEKRSRCAALADGLLIILRGVHWQPPGYGEAAPSVIAGTYVTSSTTASSASRNGNVSATTIHSGFPKRDDERNRFSPTGGVR